MGILDTFKRKTDAKPQTKSAGKKADVKPTAKKAEKSKAIKPTADFKELTLSGVLVAPAMTEKSFLLQAANKYVFYVTVESNKNQVRMAVKDTYGMEPVSVHMVKRHAQKMYRWGKEIGTRKAYKKAIVTMPKGTTLPLTTK
jgi:ribosomal protein L23